MPDSGTKTTSVRRNTTGNAKFEGIALRVAYFAHDLTDAAVGRRIAMFRRAGAEVELYGFRRSLTPPASVAGVIAHDLGPTRDGALGVRALRVVSNFLRVGTLPETLMRADVFVARNLEMLLLASRARQLFAPKARLVYELLDIHSVMLSDGIASRLLRRLEKSLLERTNLILVSSPAFATSYLNVHHPHHPPTYLVENKVMLEGRLSDALINSSLDPLSLPAGPPWRIGWFGVLRCQRSLEVLQDVCKAYPGLLEVVIRGKPTELLKKSLPELEDRSAAISFAGPYHYPDDLEDLYGHVHFTWAIDFYEAGLNSNWLLPNRIYEGSLYGSIPIAYAGVETAAWIKKNGIGLTLDDPLAESLAQAMKLMSPARYGELKLELAKVDRSAFLVTDESCQALLSAIVDERPYP